MKAIAIYLFAATILFSSCASILSTRYQKIHIDTQKGNIVKINGEDPEMKGDKYLLKRDFKAKQITVERKGFKMENYVVMQYKKSPLYIFSIIPFGILAFPPLYDIGRKSFSYVGSLTTKWKMTQVLKKEADYKYINLNKVSLNVENDNFLYRRYSSYKGFVRKRKEKPTSTLNDDIKLKIENTIFTELLNESLVSHGFTDTSKRVLKTSFDKNMLINATIKGVTFNVVKHGYWVSAMQDEMLFIDLDVKWEALDYYENTVFEYTTKTRSGQFVVDDEAEKTISLTVKDALEYGLLEFMKTDGVVELLQDYSQQEVEANMKVISIPATDSYVTNLNEAIQASVTIKSTSGHGSGFFVSSDGYVITNYHVVSDTNNLSVILSDGTEYDVVIERVSKIHDLALLKVNCQVNKPFKLVGDIEYVIGSDVFAIGTPSNEELYQTVSKGIVSGIRKIDNEFTLIQTDASVNPGNSGGVLANRDGVVFGVVSSKLTGLGIEGVAFGIPTSEVLSSLKIEIN